MTPPPPPTDRPAPGSIRLLLAWLVVGLPLAWGVLQTVLKAAVLFH